MTPNRGGYFSLQKFFESDDVMTPLHADGPPALVLTVIFY